jgi:transposase
MVEVVYERCCGLDIHKKLVVACLIAPGSGGKLTKEVRSFGTMTTDLLALADWLAAAGCTHVAMESTGVYWKPLYNLLEDQFTLLLVNAQHIKAVPGRKTDVKDCEWIADLLRHGLLKPSFVPDRPQRELRELTRYRTSLVRERSAEINRLQKTLEGANIKLASVATDIMGKSGRAILAALVAGTTDPAVLADLAKERLRQKLSQLQKALDGRIGPHQRFLLGRQLAHIEFLDDAVEQVSAEIATRLGPWEETIARLDAIPGVGRRTAEILLAEVGVDMTRFPSAGHLASWAGMCPGHDESAGKRRSGATRAGNRWLKAVLVEAAQSAGRAKATHLSARLHQLAARRGWKRAVVAVGHAILVAAYYMLRDGTPYRELGTNDHDERQRRAEEQRLIRKLQDRGYSVSREPAVA